MVIAAHHELAPVHEPRCHGLAPVHVCLQWHASCVQLRGYPADQDEVIK